VEVGVLKQTADVATAFWTLVIAIHTFCLIVLQLKWSRLTLLTTLIGGWVGIGAILMAGPLGRNTSRHGPFCQSNDSGFIDFWLTFMIDGISGYWCWIAPDYTTSRITYVRCTSITITTDST
jgi:hypothetical protein